MNVNDRMYECAKIASNLSGVPAEWIYAQWAHESTNVTEGDPDHGQRFKSELARDNNNFGGLTQVESNGEENHQPDGRFYYMKFESPEAYAIYFGKYIRKYFPLAAASQTLPEYAHNLKHQPDSDSGEEYGYYGDSEENYLAGTTKAHNEAFGDADEQ